MRDHSHSLHSAPHEPTRWAKSSIVVHSRRRLPFDWLRTRKFPALSPPTVSIPVNINLIFIIFIHLKWQGEATSCSSATISTDWILGTTHIREEGNCLSFVIIQSLVFFPNPTWRTTRFGLSWVGWWVLPSNPPCLFQFNVSLSAPIDFVLTVVPFSLLLESLE